MPEPLLRLEDRVGLVAADMFEPRPLGSPAEAAEALAEDGLHFSVAGFRASQGGHTLAPQGRMLTTEVLTRPLEVDPADYDPQRPRRSTGSTPTIRVASGALWSQLHHVLHPHGLAPLVHQSSCHFSVGGSVSVNCHGRDPRQGPLASVLRSVRVQLPDGSVRDASPDHDADLFRAVVGGYGSCGIVLAAELEVGPNLVLEQRGRVMGSVSAYARHLDDLLHGRDDGDRVHLHYGWLRCLDTRTLYDDVLSVDYVDAGLPHAVTDGALRVETWGESELMRAGWSAARKRQPGVRRDLWALAVDQVARQPQQACRLDWMRAAIGFTSYRGSEDQDILQEYFVPPAQFERMVAALRSILAGADLNVLSTTVRLVRGEACAARSHLSYAPGDRVCIAVDLNVPVDPVTRVPGEAVRSALQRCIEAAGDCGGAYYLPYYPIATPDQFRACYPGHAGQRRAMERYNPQRRLRNLFTRDYLDQA